jgi:uncharacterized protein (TIGR02217 family)
MSLSSFFHNVLFPTNISLDAICTLVRNTQINTSINGNEQRNTSWLQSKHLYEIGYGIKNLNDLHTVISFFEARQGPLYSFRFLDRFDHKSCLPQNIITYSDQLIGVGDNIITEFQLKKIYISSTYTYTRIINKPIAETVIISIDNIPTTNFILDDTTGIITFASPPNADSIITAGFHFHVPVRFENDSIEINSNHIHAGIFPEIKLQEVRNE